MRENRPRPLSTMNTMAAPIAAALLFTSLAAGQIDVGSDGSDGAFNPTAPSTVIDLSLAATGSWNTPSPVAGQGVFDPVRWCVVYKYASVNIPSNVTLTFKNHPSYAPVIWLVQGNCTIAGTVALDGADGHGSSGTIRPSEPAPGGFRGGRGSIAITTNEGSGGFGPGGAFYNTADTVHDGSGGGHVTNGFAGANGGGVVGASYGNAGCSPLIGGSGGAGGRTSTAGQIASGGGAGAGALLIGCNNTLTINGNVRANGGDGGTGTARGGGGSGGALRFVAHLITGSGTLRALGGEGSSTSNTIGDGSKGRVRLEGNTITFSANSDPVASQALPGTVFSAGTAPTLRITNIEAVGVPADPRGNLDFPNADVNVCDPDPVNVDVAASSVPIASTVTLKITLKSGQDLIVPAAFLSGDASASTWRAQLTLPSGFCAMQARVVLP